MFNLQTPCIKITFYRFQLFMLYFLIRQHLRYVAALTI